MYTARHSTLTVAEFRSSNANLNYMKVHTVLYKRERRTGGGMDGCAFLKILSGDRSVGDFICPAPFRNF